MYAATDPGIDRRYISGKDGGIAWLNPSNAMTVLVFSVRLHSCQLQQSVRDDGFLKRLRAIVRVIWNTVP